MKSLNILKPLTDRNLAPQKIRKATAQIYWNLQKESRSIRSGNFQRIGESDLAFLFEQYDEFFFDSRIMPLLKQLGHPLTFRLSGRMTRAGGKTTREENWRGRHLVHRRYEIAVSTTLLFQTFKDDSRKVLVTGIECTDRLQALQRIMEHEIIHLVEMIGWYHSDCFRQRFKSIARGLFEHRESTHQLTTVDERALAEFGIKVGDRVSFVHDSTRYQGFVNRITKRATVLVESAGGELFSDGKRYTRFYVPISNLRLERQSA